MPVIGDLSVLHAIDVTCAEANLATVVFQIFEAAGEMSGKAASNNTRSNCIERDDAPCCSAKNLQSLSAAVVLLWAPAAEIGLLARPTAAAVLVVINVLRFMVMEWFGFSVRRAMQLLRLEPQLPPAWKRRPSDWPAAEHT
jgi:hypothetical protein